MPVVTRSGRSHNSKYVPYHVHKTLKTAHEWYQLDHTRDILDADGWDRRNRYISQDYYFALITYEEYKDRTTFCTQGPYNYIHHIPLFPMPTRYM